MFKGCDRMRYGTCQFYKENVAPKIVKDGLGNLVAPSSYEYNCYCNTFDKFERCPYYSSKNFNNQQIRDEYKKSAKKYNSPVPLIVIIAIIIFALKSCGVF